MKAGIIICLHLILIPLTQAGVYGELEYGDTRETVTAKLRKSPLVTLTVNETFLGRTGLNGIFKCKAKLAGLSCHLFFNWDQRGGLEEITLRTDSLEMDQYGESLRRAWNDTEHLFSQVYGPPSQKAPYPSVQSFKQHTMLVSHVWQQGENQSILMGTGIDKNKCFLFVRFANQDIALNSGP